MNWPKAPPKRYANLLLLLLGSTIASTSVETKPRNVLRSLRSLWNLSQVALSQLWTKVGRMPRKRHVAKLMASAITVVIRTPSRTAPSSPKKMLRLLSARLLWHPLRTRLRGGGIVRNRTPILEIRAEAEFRAVRTDHSAAPLHSFVARPFFYSVVAFLVFCLYSPLRCPEHLRQYRRLSI